MKTKYQIEGFAFRLRPVKISDAQFIIDARLQDKERNKYIHEISSDVEVEKNWIKNYLEREDDFYFVIENRFTGKAEGLIGISDVKGGKGEWGRWTILKDSLAAIESVLLIYRLAFEQAGLEELYCRTITENTTVVSFHQSFGEKERTVLKNQFELRGQKYDAVEQYATKECFYSEILPRQERFCRRIADKFRNEILGSLEFHHIGIACKNIEKEICNYTLMGYNRESDYFVDENQGIRGVFLVAKNQPRLELLENLPNSSTLTKQVDENIKMYHTGYVVENIESALDVFLKNKAVIVSPLKDSAYFRKKICFLMLRNMQMIELIESSGGEQ